MTRRLMILTRLLLLVVMLTSLLAFAVAGIEGSATSTTPALTGRWDAIHDTSWLRHCQGEGHFYLIDRETGRCNPISLPTEVHWEDVSISPWSGPAGSAEAVGLCTSLSAHGNTDGFLGLARVRLPEGRIIDRVETDVLPTSRPCWIPDRPNSIVFAAGDGQLYRHDFASPSNLEDGPAGDPGGSVPELPLRPLVWNCPRPSAGTFYLTDPTWPSAPRLRHLLLATMIGSPRHANDNPAKGTRLWWLHMNRDGMSIDSSGPLFEFAPADEPSSEEIRRFPTLALGGGGQLRLAYLTHDPGQSQGKLQTVRIHVDPASGQPRVVAGTHRVIAEDCASVAPVFSADGESIFSVSAATGQLKKYPVDPTGQVQRRFNVARTD